MSSTLAGATRPAPAVAGPTAATGAESWGGRALLLLLGSILLHAVVARVLDGARVVEGSDGRNTTIQDGQFSTLVSVTLFSAAVLCAGRGLFELHSARTKSVFAGSVQLLVIWWALMTTLIPRSPGGLRPKDLVIIGAPILILAIVGDPPTSRTVARINILRDVFAVTNLGYALLLPDIGQTECRDDKCGIFGTMYTGFFVQENTAPALVSMLVPLSAAVRTNRRFAASAVIAVLVALASGSRTGLASTLVGIAAALYVRWKARRGGPLLEVGDLVAAIPLAASMASLAVFLTADPEAFTGRGRIYAGIREALSGAQLWYGVPWNTVLKATDGYMTADHGQAPHVLARAGVVGLTLWLAAMTALLFYGRFTRQQLLGLAILVSGSATMFTESAFELDVRTPGFFAMLLAVGLLSGPGIAGRTQQDAPERSTRQKATTVALVGTTGALVAGILLLSPPVYRASTAMSFSPSPDRSRQARDALEAAQVRAESYAQLVESRRVIERALQGADVQMDVAQARRTVSATRRELATVVTVTFDGTSAQQAQRVNDTIVSETVNLAKALEQQPRGQAQVYPSSLGTSKVFRVSPLAENGTAVATILTLAAVLVWNTWRQRPGRVVRPPAATAGRHRRRRSPRDARRPWRRQDPAGWRSWARLASSP